MGTNWFMPALVNRRLGESGSRLEEGTMECCFDSKKSRNDWRISELVMGASEFKVQSSKFELRTIHRLRVNLRVLISNGCKSNAMLSLTTFNRRPESSIKFASQAERILAWSLMVTP